MHVLIDATGITRKKAGVGVYARNLLDHLTRETGDLHFLILAQNDDPEMDFSRRPNVTMLWVPARVFRLLPFRFLLEQIYLWHRGVRVVHSLHYAFPLFTPGTLRVVTFHDMTFFNMPEVHQRFKVFYFRTFMKAAMRRADHIIFISHSAMQDARARLGAPRGRASVIPHGKSDSLRPDLPPERLFAVRSRYGIAERFLLYIGTVEPRKNLPRVVEAFASLAARHTDLQLVIAGKMGWMTEDLTRSIEQLQLESRVLFTGFIDEKDKAPLLAACTVFVYASLYEGFGLPALEALACGAPTVTSNLSSLPEVVGDAALLVDPLDTCALAEAMERLLSTPLLRQRLQKEGPERAAQFTWERTAALTAALYRALPQEAWRAKS